MTKTSGFQLRKPLSVLLACLLATAAVPSLALANDEGDQASIEAASEVIDAQNDDMPEPLEPSDDEPSPADEVASGEESLEQTEEFPFASEITDEEIDAVLSELGGASEGGSIAPFSLDARSVNEAATAGSVRPFSGDDRYETAAIQAVSGWQTSRYAIVAGGEGWPDALAASSLAGALDCPVLLTPKASLDKSTKDALSSMHVERVIIVGDVNSVSTAAADQIAKMGIAVDRLGGDDRYETQMLIYGYGLDASRNVKGEVLWDSKLVVVASGVSPADALSVSPVAFAAKAPVFLTDESCSLSAAQKAALSTAGAKASFGKALVMGDVNRVSKAAESTAASATSGGTVRFAGTDRYDTSVRVATWGVSNGYLKWNGSAFATGKNPADALGGGALQGREGLALLLVDDGYCGYATKALKGKGVSYVKFFGGTPSVSGSSRVEIISSLNLAPIFYTDYNISLSYLADLEVAAVAGYASAYNKSQALESLDPNNFAFGTRYYYQFAVLTDGYSGSVSASQLNSFIATSGSNGMLAGTGAYFIEAAQTYGMNEVYLLSNAILESGWGKSQLAMGYYYDGKTKVNGKTYPAGTYYNFFGIGAVDSGPLSGGRARAIMEGWNSPKKAILGAAKWISNNYHKPTVASGAVSGPQNTLYRMKWDVRRAAAGGGVWHQYATSRTWATGISSVMYDCYSYARVPMDKTGLVFDVPRYR